MFKRVQEKADQHRETEVPVTGSQDTDGQEKRHGRDNTVQPACSLPVSHKQDLLEL